MTDRPLRPVTDRSLGKPLPYQLANLPQAPLQANCSFNNCHHKVPLHYAVLASVSRRYSPLEGRLLTCYSPVRHFISFPKESLIVRLACLRHAASVDSEPGSNSRSFPGFKSYTGSFNSIRFFLFCSEESCKSLDSQLSSLKVL